MEVIWFAEPGEGKLNQLLAEKGPTEDSVRVRLTVKKGEVVWESSIREVRGIGFEALRAAVAQMPAKWKQIKEVPGATYRALRIWFLPETDLFLCWKVEHTEVIEQPTKIEDSFKVVKVSVNGDEMKLLLSIAT